MGFLCVFLALLGGLVLLGWYYFERQRDIIIEKANDELSAIAYLKTERISTWITERISDGTFLSTSGVVAEDLQAFLRNPDDAVNRRRILNWLNLIKRGNRYSLTAIFDAKLNQILTFPHLPPGISLLDNIAREHIKDISRTGRLGMGEIRLDPVSGKPFLDITAPVFAPAPPDANPADRPKEEPVAYFLLRLDPEVFLYPFIQEWPTASNTAETLLVCQDGKDILFLNELRHRKNTAVRFRLPIAATADLPATQAVLGRKGLFQGKDYRNEPVVAVLSRIDKTPWFMVSKVDEAELYAPIRTLFWQIAAVVAALVVFAAWLIMRTWRRYAGVFRQRQQLDERQRQILSSRILYFNEYANDIILLADSSMRIIEANRSALAAYEHSAEQLRTMNLLDLTAPAQRDDFRRSLNDVRVQENRLHSSMHRKASGTEFPVEVSVCQIELDGQRYYQCIIRDISERVRAMEALRLREERLHAFFDSDLVGTLFGDIHGRIFRTNDEFLRIIGYSQEDLAAGRIDWKTITPAEHIPRDLLHILEAQKTGSCHPYEKQYIRKDGSRVWVLVGYILVGASREESVAFILDLTELKRAEEDLRINQERLIKSQEIGRIGSLEYDPAQATIWMSEEGFRLFGWPGDRGPATLEEFAELIQQREEFHQNIAESLESGKELTQEYTILRGENSRELIFSFKLRPVPNGEAAQPRLVGVIQDITLQKHAESEILQLNDQLAQMNAELEERVRARTQELEERCREIEELNRQTTQLAEHLRVSNYSLEETAQRLALSNQELEAFSYSVSHDLRAPLRALDGFSSALLEDYATAFDDQGKDYLNRIKLAAQRMGRLIDDLLKLSRITRVEMQQQTIDLSGMVRKIVNELSEEHPERRYELVVREELQTCGDEPLLRIALENILGNAWKFTRHSPLPKIEFGTLGCQPVETEESAGEAAYEKFPLEPGESAPQEQIFFVRDNGAGFDMKYAGKLFGAFQRMHNSSQFEGTGIGLATVRRVMQRHGGRVWAEGIVDVGTTVFFALPVGLPATPAEPD